MINPDYAHIDKLLADPTKAKYHFVLRRLRRKTSKYLPHVGAKHAAKLEKRRQQNLRG